MLPNAARVNAGFCLTPSRAQGTCGPPHGAGPRKGQRRLCDEEANGARRCDHDLTARSASPRSTGAPGPTSSCCSRRPRSSGPCYEALKRPWHALRQSWHSRPTILVRRPRMRILYVLNGFDQGGAEHGLLTLVENGAFEDHELRVLALCRGRGDLADVSSTGSGKRVQFVTDSDTLTFWACSAGFFSILRTSFAFRPQKMVLSLKQANVVGRSAAMLMPRSDLRGLRAHRGIPSAPVPGALRTAAALAVQTRRRGVGRFAQRRSSRRAAISSLAVAKAMCPPLRRGGRGAVQDRLCARRSGVRLAAAGRLVAARIWQPLIEAMVHALRREGVDATLDVYGDGPEAAIEALLVDRGLQDHVTLHGYRADWVSQATKADVFLNLSEAEGFCIVVAEAMLAGLPVVAVDVGGIRDYGVDGENMLKLPCGNRRGRPRGDSPPDGDQLTCASASGSRARADMLRGYDAVACRQQVAEALAQHDGEPSPRHRSTRSDRHGSCRRTSLRPSAAPTTITPLCAGACPPRGRRDTACATSATAERRRGRPRGPFPYGASGCVRLPISADGTSIPSPGGALCICTWLWRNRRSYDLIYVVHGRLHAFPAATSGRWVRKPVVVKPGRGGDVGFDLVGRSSQEAARLVLRAKHRAQHDRLGRKQPGNRGRPHAVGRAEASAFI